MGVSTCVGFLWVFYLLISQDETPSPPHPISLLKALPHSDVWRKAYETYEMLWNVVRRQTFTHKKTSWSYMQRMYNIYRRYVWHVAGAYSLTIRCVYVSKCWEHALIIFYILLQCTYMFYVCQCALEIYVIHSFSIQMFLCHLRSNEPVWQYIANPWKSQAPFIF